MKTIFFLSLLCILVLSPVLSAQETDLNIASSPATVAGDMQTGTLGGSCNGTDEDGVRVPESSYTFQDVQQPGARQTSIEKINSDSEVVAIVTEDY
jgi:hypothetical protein